MMKKNLLITGAPASGKTTLLRRAVKSFPGAVGFFTEEMREGGERMGFQIAGLDGRRALFAHRGIRGHGRVGSYGVNIPVFEGFLAATPFDSPEARLVVIDEIGRMECLSADFRRLVLELLDGPVPVVATAALHGDEFIEGIKARPDLSVFVVTRENRDDLLNEVRAEIAVLLGERKPEEPPYP
ncbi:nucleoside-triphosphatase [Methanofollis fontis]|uniref:AAA family ATPase n=1 Tax=Methanofollis fontis TaxID=2052832 RepID=A0A483CWR3_9EURY|nr:nucleoside-triphosphatase [Methanofollis fontis]TAJ45670.1 AAA family ATPase [Methanofollis fontis]